MMTVLNRLSSSFTPATWARRFNAARLAAFLGLALIITATGRAQNAPPAQAPAQSQAQPATTTKPAEYVGSETCKTCHEDVAKTFQKNPHVLVESASKYRFETKACESCHGPGSKHAESASAADIVQPAKLKPAETDRTCLKCHLNQQTHVGRISGGHAKNQVSCTSCHAVHGGGNSLLGANRPAGKVAGILSTSAKPSKSMEINQQCAGCHSEVWASFQRPHRHKLPEGAMSCVDCHNPHGSMTLASTKTSQTMFRGNEPGCLRCHGDLAGPFAFEHAPVRTDGCVACHMPHGSNNPKMMTRSEVRFMCLECHSNLPGATQGQALGDVPPAFHDLRSPRYRECTVCHQKIHGSYLDRGLRR